MKAFWLATMDSKKIKSKSVLKLHQFCKPFLFNTG